MPKNQQFSGICADLGGYSGEFFRGWLIVQGCAVFERAVAEPDTLAEPSVVCALRMPPGLGVAAVRPPRLRRPMNTQAQADTLVMVAGRHFVIVGPCHPNIDEKRSRSRKSRGSRTPRRRARSRSNAAARAL